MIAPEQIQYHNQAHLPEHETRLNFIQGALERQGVNPGQIIAQIRAFQIAIPSWALGSGGTRFGRFSIGGEPSNLEEKIEDVGLIHQLNRSANSISLHIPWDIPPAAIKLYLDYSAEIAHR